MKLLVCLVTYNRLAYTQRTIKSLLQTISCPYYLIVVDNASNDGTQSWLRQQKKLGHINHLILNKQNLYPGKACNIGWSKGLAKYTRATYLMRLDNDMRFYEGWANKVPKYFAEIHNLGQLGIDYVNPQTVPQKTFVWQPYGNGDGYQFVSKLKVKDVTIVVWPGNVGGPCIIKRELWDKGLRYDESPWQDDNTLDHFPTQEDAKLCIDILKLGYTYGTAGQKLAQTFAVQSNWDEYPQYYIQTLTERGYHRFRPDIIDKLRSV